MNQNTHTQNKESQSSIKPEMAIDLLKSGNDRFVEGVRISRNYNQQVNLTTDGQWPFAAVLSCIDSRVPAEIIFDQGIGDIFSVRVAGNFVNTDILGSLEYACAVAGSKAIVVMGHSACGAVKGACDQVKLGNITPMLDNIQPAIDAITDEQEDRTSANESFVQKVADKNVVLTIQSILDRSEVLKELIEANKITIVGAMYDTKTGKVEFM